MSLKMMLLSERTKREQMPEVERAEKMEKILQNLKEKEAEIAEEIKRRQPTKALLEKTCNI